MMQNVRTIKMVTGPNKYKLLAIVDKVLLLSMSSFCTVAVMLVSVKLHLNPICPCTNHVNKLKTTKNIHRITARVVFVVMILRTFIGNITEINRSTAIHTISHDALVLELVIKTSTDLHPNADIYVRLLPNRATIYDLFITIVMTSDKESDTASAHNVYLHVNFRNLELETVIIVSIL